MHGGGSTADQWLPLMAQLDGYRMIAVDRPGCGLTSGFIYSRADDLRAHAVTFLEKVADAAGLGPVDIIANSMGALWSLWFAIDHPDLIPFPRAARLSGPGRRDIGAFRHAAAVAARPGPPA